MSGGQRVRADELLVRQGLASSRSQAKVLILAGEVRTPDGRVQKPSELLAADTQLMLDQGPRYVSRGGLKLEAALHTFRIDVTGLVAADLGASTGGFTDCLLQHGAARVYAIDVGYGQLDYRLRQDPRVVVMERTNARYLESLPEAVDLVVIDTSFISLKLILPAARRIAKQDASVIALIKPQFEAGREAVGRRGVVKDEKVRERAVRDVLSFALDEGFRLLGLMRSPIAGPAGNEEFLAYLTLDASGASIPIEDALTKVFGAPS